MATYRRVQEAISQLFSTLPPAEAQKQIDIARVLAYDRNNRGRWFQAMLEIGDTLRNEDLLPPGAGGIAAARAELTGEPLVTFIYVNGINTDPIEANTTIASYLTPLLSEAGFRDRTVYPVRRSYNVSATLTEEGATWECLSNLGIAATVGIWSAVQQLGVCFGIVVDLVQSLRQVSSRVLGFIPPTDDVQHLVQVTESVLESGSRAVLVGHSQGNLVINDALQFIAESKPNLSLDCIGVVSIAPPIPISRGSRSALLSSLIIKGKYYNDILYFPFETQITGIPTVTNVLSDAWDTYTSPTIFDLFVSGVQLHDIDHSYISLGGTSGGTRAAIKSAVVNQVSAVSSRCPATVPVSLRMTSTIQNAELPWQGTNVDVNVPVTVALQSGTLTGTSPVIAQLYLSAKEKYATSSYQIWTSSSSDFTAAVLNTNGSRSVTAKFRLPSTFSPTAFYSLYGQLSRNSVQITQPNNPLVGLITFFQYPLTQLPLQFPSDATYPTGEMPYRESYIVNYGGQRLSGAPTGVRLSALTFYVNGAQTVRTVYDYYKAYLLNHGFLVTYDSVETNIAALYGKKGVSDPLTQTDCNFVVGFSGSRLQVQLVFAYRYPY